MEFFKYEATGNDFIVVDAMEREQDLSSEEVARLCDRHRGVGADGVLVLLPSSSCDARMRILNADGSEAEMCGNGVRALALFGLDSGRLKGETLSFETLAGIREVRVVSWADGSGMFTVDMGAPAYTRGSIPMLGERGEETVEVSVETGVGNSVRATCVSMGNPHCVLFVDDVDSYPVGRVGPYVENSVPFPERTNVEFVQVEAPGRLKVRVWERGVGETMACGTGACAAAVAASLTGRVEREASVSLPGGSLEVRWRETVEMTGPAESVFRGEVLEF